MALTEQVSATVNHRVVFEMLGESLIASCCFVNSYESAIEVCAQHRHQTSIFVHHEVLAHEISVFVVKTIPPNLSVEVALVSKDFNCLCEKLFVF